MSSTGIPLPRYVNTAMNRGYAGGSSSEKNCAICTAAGACNLCHGSSLLSTGALADYLKCQDSKESMGDSVDKQATAIAKTVTELTTRRSEQIGGMTAGVSYSNAIAWMQKFSDGTVFALCVSGQLNIESQGENRCHWLNALKAGGNIRYFDFQSNRTFKASTPPGGRNPATSTVPMVGVISQLNGKTSKEMHSAGQQGTFATGTVTCVVIAFPKS